MMVVLFPEFYVQCVTKAEVGAWNDASYNEDPCTLKGELEHSCELFLLLILVNCSYYSNT